MLSRAANGLFWMSRYIERAENIARLLDAGRRMDALPGTFDTRQGNWASIIIAAGCEATFTNVDEQANRDTAIMHLLFDKENPSSIRSCLFSARENARAMRGYVTTEMWQSINETREEFKNWEQVPKEQNLAQSLEWVKNRGAQVRGAIEATHLRNNGYNFIELGKWIERADCTARLLDVKYHVLLPKVDDVGSAVDHLQWQQILRAANALRSYRHIYRRPIDARGVADLLVLNNLHPRSLLRCAHETVHNLEKMGTTTQAQWDLLQFSVRLRDETVSTTIDEIINHGMHEWLTQRIMNTNFLAQDLGLAFGFQRADAPTTESVQSQ